MKCAASYTVVVLSGTVFLFAETPDFSGTWRLDPEHSQVTAAAGMPGLIGVGAPEALHITQAANGTLVIESQINESHARIYMPGRESSTPVFVGQAGQVTVTSRWDGGSLVSEGTREYASGSSTSVTEIKEVLSLGAEGRTLEIEIRATGSEGESASRLTYIRIRDVGPCGKWPSPCKSFSR